MKSVGFPHSLVLTCSSSSSMFILQWPWLSRASALLTKILGSLRPAVCTSAGLEGRKEGWILSRFPVLLWVTDTKHFSCSSLPAIRRAGMQPQKSNRNHPLRHDNDSRCGKQARSALLQEALPPSASKELKERLAISLPFVRREWRQEEKNPPVSFWCSGKETHFGEGMQNF